MVWPSGNPFLQFCVLMCVILLVAGRVSNVFVPIYYKLISKLTILTIYLPYHTYHTYHIILNILITLYHFTGLSVYS